MAITEGQMAANLANSIILLERWRRDDSVRVLGYVAVTPEHADALITNARNIIAENAALVARVRELEKAIDEFFGYRGTQHEDKYADKLSAALASGADGGKDF